MLKTGGHAWLLDHPPRRGPPPPHQRALVRGQTGPKACLGVSEHIAVAPPGSTPKPQTPVHPLTAPGSRLEPRCHADIPGAFRGMD